MRQINDIQNKPGILSTEFWGKVIISVLGFGLVLYGHLQSDVYWGALAVIWTIYGVERYSLKSTVNTVNGDNVAAIIEAFKNEYLEPEPESNKPT